MSAVTGVAWIGACALERVGVGFDYLAITYELRGSRPMERKRLLQGPLSI